MHKLKVHYYGDPILRKRCLPVEEITDEIRELARLMIETSDKTNGIGIAAPQVGYPIRMFVCRNYVFDKDGQWFLSEPQVYINPKLSNPGEGILTDVEGCLSFPKIQLEIDRPDSIVIEALDLNGKFFREEVEGYNARVRMHENDHINGVLFIDRIDAATRKKLEPLLRAIKKKHNP